MTIAEGEHAGAAEILVIHASEEQRALIITVSTVEEAKGIVSTDMSSNFILPPKLTDTFWQAPNWVTLEGLDPKKALDVLSPGTLKVICASPDPGLLEPFHAEDFSLDQNPHAKELLRQENAVCRWGMRRALSDKPKRAARALGVLKDSNQMWSSLKNTWMEECVLIGEDHQLGEITAWRVQIAAAPGDVLTMTDVKSEEDAALQLAATRVYKVAVALQISAWIWNQYIVTVTHLWQGNPPIPDAGAAELKHPTRLQTRSSDRKSRPPMEMPTLVELVCAGGF